MGTRPLLLLPAAQVKLLIQEINDTFNSNLILPTGVGKGFVLPFTNEKNPKPSLLGQFSSREEKDKLEYQIPPRHADGGNNPVEDPDYVEMLGCAIAATKNRKKGGGSSSKTKKEQMKFRTQHDWMCCLKRSQCYFGFRSRRSRGGDTEDKAAAFPPFDENEPAQCPFWHEPIFISVDVESNERAHSQITEVGISTLDTLDLVGVPPGKDCENWIAKIKSRHLRTREYSHVVNCDFVNGCPEMFEYGQSEWVRLRDLVPIVSDCFQPPFSHEGENVPEHKKRMRNVVFVGHNSLADVHYLQNMGITVFGDRVVPFLDNFDTAEVFRIHFNEANHRSLGSILAEFGITPWNLHNAGNDARYTLEAMMRIVLRSKLSDEGNSDEFDGGEPRGVL